MQTPLAAHYRPARRERKLHIGLFGYSRQVGGHKLPHAIAFTAAMYSLGVPPELVGTGRALSSASAADLDFLEETYPSMRSQISRACRFVNFENIEVLAGAHAGWRKVRQDVAAIEDFMGEKAGPHSEEEYIHRNCAANLRIMAWKGDPRATQEIERSAQLRESLG